MCNRLNTYIIPEAGVHGFLTFLFLINGYWLPLILNAPLLAWNIKKYVELFPRAKAHNIFTLDTFTNECARIADNAHLLDATEIFRKLNVHKKVRHVFPGTLPSHIRPTNTFCRSLSSSSAST